MPLLVGVVTIPFIVRGLGTERFGLLPLAEQTHDLRPDPRERNSKKELLQFLYIFLGSISELEIQLIIADKLGFLLDKEIFPLIEKERYKLLGLIKYPRGDKHAPKQ
ncbi:MAG: four helix bundle protein [Deltaproteobacteria bacterium]|nr:four helix bundle protein [Deltaproteobacteria bacterium]